MHKRLPCNAYTMIVFGFAELEFSDKLAIVTTSLLDFLLFFTLFALVFLNNSLCLSSGDEVAKRMLRTAWQLTNSVS